MQSNGKMTIFYSGTMNHYDDILKVTAQDIMLSPSGGIYLNYIGETIPPKVFRENHKYNITSI